MSWRAIIRAEEWTGSELLYLLYEAEGKVRLATPGPDGVLLLTEYSEGDPQPAPFLRLRGPLAREIFPAIVAELSGKGWERPSESTLRGKVEAMGAHLADLRRLLKLDRKAS